MQCKRCVKTIKAIYHDGRRISFFHSAKDKKIKKDSHMRQWLGTEDFREKQYCSKCHNLISLECDFCLHCGKLLNKNVVKDYLEVAYRGINNDCIKVTKKGVLLYTDGFTLFGRNEKLIPYEAIRSLNLRPGTVFEQGYLSIITDEGGVKGNISSLSTKGLALLNTDGNTIRFRLLDNSKYSEISSVIKEICEDKTLLNIDYEYEYGDFSRCTESMTGQEFEYYCANLLKRNGFVNISVTPGTGDQGVDVLAEKDGIKYAIQCKCYSSPLGNTSVQEVNAGKAFYNCHVGVVMTNSIFTSSAKQLAEATGVLLWDKEKISSLEVG